MTDRYRACMDCAEPVLVAEGRAASEGYASYCDDCKPKRADNRGTHTERGYDARWERLSKRALRLQRFCSVVGCTSTDLTADHSPEAWERREAGLSIRLRDVDVLCRSHNARKGAAR